MVKKERETKLFEEMRIATLKANMAARPPMDVRKFRALIGKVQAALEVKSQKQKTISRDTD